MKKEHGKAVICVIALLIVAAVNYGNIALNVQKETSGSILFLDPGHGGIDGGAVSAGGVPEKNINLQIALELRDMAEDYGWQVVMTRETDEGLYESQEGSIRSMKTADLRMRRQLLQEYQPEIAVSIHLNSFKEDPSVSGVQVFYPDEGGSSQLLEQSKRFAEVLQESLTEELQIEKKRTPLVRDGVFLLKEVICPIVIVECGFLSNPEEAQLLQKQEYQQKLAQGIMDGITDFTRKRKELPEIIDSLK